MALKNQEIAGRIRELRGGRPQTVVADEVGVAERTYQNWEAGDAKPSYRSLQKLAAYYGVGEDYILSGAAVPPPRDGAGSTPDPFVSGAIAERLDRMEERLADLIEKQNALLSRQSDILERIEAAVDREDQLLGAVGAVFSDDDGLAGFERHVQDLRRALREPDQPAQRAGRRGRSAAARATG
jgi:transcriptional regulator with XRE-family HTH domain